MTAIDSYERLLDGKIISVWHTAGEYLLDPRRGWAAELGPYWWATTQRIGFHAYDQTPAWAGIPYQDITAVTIQAGGVVMLSAAGYPQLAAFRSNDPARAQKGIQNAIVVAKTQGARLLADALREALAQRAQPLLRSLTPFERDALNLRIASAILPDMSAVDNLLSRLFQLEDAALRGVDGAALAEERRRILAL